MRAGAPVVYEGFWRRMLAGLVDLILALVAVVTLSLVGLLFDGTPPDAPGLVADLAGLAGYGGWLMGMTLVAQVLFWTFLGATPGMLLLGCQVLEARTLHRLPLARSCVRAVGLWLGLACLGVGVLWIIRDPRHQGLHDKLARSVVIKEDESLLALDELLGSVK